MKDLLGGLDQENTDSADDDGCYEYHSDWNDAGQVKCTTSRNWLWSWWHCSSHYCGIYEEFKVHWGIIWPYLTWVRCSRDHPNSSTGSRSDWYSVGDHWIQISDEVHGDVSSQVSWPWGPSGFTGCPGDQVVSDKPSGLNWRQRIPADKNGASIHGGGLDTQWATGSWRVERF